MTAFYVDNEARSYPIAAGDRSLVRRSDSAAITLPDAALVDFGCVVGPDSGWLAGTDSVTLARVSRAGATFTFAFAATAPGLDGRTLAFDRTLGGPEFVPSFATATPDDGDRPGCPDGFLWDGFLVTGTLDDLAALLADGDAADAALPVEPALVQDLSTPYVRSLSTANGDRAHATAVADCADASSGSSSSSFAAAPAYPGAPAPRLYVDDRCIVGAITLRPGFNCAIRRSTARGGLVIAAQAGAGAGQPQAEVPLYAGETPPAGSIYLSGGPACDEVLHAVCGISAEAIRLVAGPGFSIRVDPADPHAAIVDLDAHDVAACDAFVESSQYLDVASSSLTPPE